MGKSWKIKDGFDPSEVRRDRRRPCLGKEDVRSLQGDMQTLKGDVKTLKEDVQTLKDRVTNIEITLENETNRNIQLIAEGHLNLDRKLNEALKELQPNTMYHLKVNHLDGEVTKMKRMLNMA